MQNTCDSGDLHNAVGHPTILSHEGHFCRAMIPDGATSCATGILALRRFLDLCGRRHLVWAHHAGARPGIIGNLGPGFNHELESLGMLNSEIVRNKGAQDPRQRLRKGGDDGLVLVLFFETLGYVNGLDFMDDC